MSKLALFGGKPAREKKFIQWPIVGPEERAALLKVFDSSIWGIGGTEISKFQESFALLHDVRFGVAVMNGTISLEIALKAGEVGDGDEVIVPAYTFVATATAVLNANAIPVFVDIDPETYCIDPNRIQDAITPRTKAIIPVHFAGHPAQMEAIGAIAKSHDLLVIEDAAQAHFAEWDGKKVGSFGHLASFSFQNSKNMSSGEGGIVITNDEKLADRCWSYHNCGREKGGEWYHHPFLGSNYRMTELQAAILLAQIPRALNQVEIRQENARYLREKLSALPGITPLRMNPRVTKHAYHLFVVKYDKQQLNGLPRSAFLAALTAEGIPASRGYVPLYGEGYLEEAKKFYLKASNYTERDYTEISLPETESACKEGVWLPHNVLLGSKADLDDIVHAFEKVIEHHAELMNFNEGTAVKEKNIIFGRS